MSSPLKLVPQLRQFAKNGDVNSYLQTEYRQNLKAIEDAFRRIGADFSGNASIFSELRESIEANKPLVVSGPEISSASETGSSYVSSGHVVSIESNGRPIQLFLQQGRSFSDTFSIYSTSVGFVEIRRNGSKIHRFDVADPLGSLSIIDRDPPGGTVTYEIFFRQPTSGTVYILRAQLLAFRT